MVTVSITAGDLADRMVIARIKAIHTGDDRHVQAANTWANYWCDAYNKGVHADADEYDGLLEKLREVNLRLWDLEDRIRGTLDKDAVLTAIYAKRIVEANDLRSAIKCKIDVLCNEFPAESVKYYATCKETT